MDSITGYTSSDPSSPEEESQEESESVALAEELVPFLDNYMKHRTGLFSTFFNIVWLLKPQDRLLLRSCYDKTTAAVKEQAPGTFSKLTFDFSALPHASHKYVGNRNAVRNAHLTLYPNLVITKNQIQKLGKMVRRGLLDVEVPSELVGDSGGGMLTKMLDNDKKEVTFRFEDKPGVLFSNATRTIFFCLNIYQGKNKDSPEYEYLRSLSRAVNYPVQSMGIDANWNYFVGSRHTIQEDGMPEFKYHSTFIISTMKVSSKLSTKEFKNLRDIVSKVDLLKEMRALRFTADALSQRTNCGIQNVMPLLPSQRGTSEEAGQAPKS